jgi:hypothetical protein
VETAHSDRRLPDDGVKLLCWCSVDFEPGIGLLCIRVCLEVVMFSPIAPARADAMAGALSLTAGVDAPQSEALLWGGGVKLREDAV